MNARFIAYLGTIGILGFAWGYSAHVVATAIFGANWGIPVGMASAIVGGFTIGTIGASLYYSRPNGTRFFDD